MESISFQPIGKVKSSFSEPRRPEEMRAEVSQLVLDPNLKDAVSGLEIGQHIWVVYHLHLIKPEEGVYPEILFQRRTPRRPNPIAITLVQVIGTQETTITVAGLDAVNGSPILDIKPYSPKWDELPVDPAERKANRRKVIALTGGPGGGKSSLIEDMRNDPEWGNRFVALPEAVQYARFINILPGEKLFQRAIVQLQIGLEESLKGTFGSGDDRPIICHRGSLDALAFWRQRGWPESEFYTFCGLGRSEHYQRYTAVIHLVTAAEGVSREYTRWPQAHRPEEPDEAIQLDHWLEHAWKEHPNYYRLDNQATDWETKSRRARDILKSIIKE
jgi:tRNA-Thr(GGU) m(6)t(6)A37 methyltransferase TsaA